MFPLDDVIMDYPILTVRIPILVRYDQESQGQTSAKNEKMSICCQNILLPLHNISKLVQVLSQPSIYDCS